MFENLSRLGSFGMEGNPPTRDNSSPYKPALVSVILKCLLQFYY